MNLESEIGVALSGVKMELFTRFDVKFFFNRNLNSCVLQAVIESINRKKGRAKVRFIE